uniref:Uncharacterized protein n=1 Tax=Sphaerodactylus townsendi TaxID=933632 RepID=A0ACB8G5N1_9SAUR
MASGESPTTPGPDNRPFPGSTEDLPSQGGEWCQCHLLACQSMPREPARQKLGGGTSLLEGDSLGSTPLAACIHGIPSSPFIFMASGTYKQCADKKKRSECGCTNNMKLSFYVAFSDCKEKAIRMKYPVVKLPLHFTVENENGIVNLSSPYFITIKEVNNRTNWEIIDANQTSSLLKMRRYLADTLDATLYTPEGLTLYIHGSELFHFRVATVHGVSFCSLFDEFQPSLAEMVVPGFTLGQKEVSSNTLEEAFRR